MSRTTTTAVVLRHLLTDRAAGAAVALVVLASALLGAGVPRALERLSTEGLRATIDQAAPLDRDLLASVVGQPPVAYGTTGDPTLPFRQVLDDVQERLEPLLAASSGGVQGTIRYRSVAVEDISPVLPDDTDTSYFNLTVLTDPTDVADPGLAGRVRYVDGGPPRAAEVIRDPGSTVPPDQPAGAEEGSALVEVAVSVEGARVHGLAPGSVVSLSQRLQARVTGVVEPLDPDDPYWQLDATLLDPAQSYTDREGIIHTTALMVAPEAAAVLAGQMFRSSQPQVQVRVPLRAADVRADEAARLFGEVRRLEGLTFTMPETPGIEVGFFAFPAPDVRLSSNLDGLVLDHLRQQRTSAAVVSVVSAGLLGVTLAVLTLAARLVVERRRRALSLLVARGGSARQVALVSLVEGLVLGVPAAVLGAGLADRLVEGDGGRVGWWLPALLGLAPEALLPVLAVLGTRDGGAEGLRGRRRDAAAGLLGGGRRRLVGEGVLVLVTAAAVLALRQRGLEPPAVPRSGTVDPSALGTAPDPLLATAPVLIGLVTAVLVARLAPLPLRRLARLAARRRGAVTFLGAARSGRDQVAGTLPVLVVLLAICTCVLGVVVSGTAQRGLRDASWEQVGAQARTTTLGLTEQELEATAQVDGVRDVAAVSLSRGRAATATREADVEVVVADPARLAAVQADVPGAQPPPTDLAALDGDRVPLVVATRVGAVGDDVAVEFGGSSFDGVVVATADRLVSLAGTDDWVLADPRALDEVGYPYPQAQVALLELAPGLADGPGPEVDRVERDVRAAIGTGAPLLTRAEAEQRIADRPLVRGTLGSFGWAAGLSAVLCAAALLLTLVAAAAERVRLLSRLRTLGLDGRQSGSLVAWEAAPVVVPGVLVGVLVGFGVTLAIYPALDLRAFTGGTERPALALDLGLLAWSVGGVLAASALAVVLAVLTGSRARLGAVLRVGDET